MEPKKKPGLVRVLILAISALTMVLTGLAVATTASATPDAKSPCPENFILSEDGKSCYQHAQSQTTTTPAECKTGHVTPDGKHCWSPAVVTPQTTTETVAATSTPQAPSYSCPAGFTSNGAGAGKTCTKQVTTQTSAAPNVSPNAPIYSCPAGSTATGSGPSIQCTTTQTNQTQQAPNVSPNPPIYSCPAGSTQTGAGASIQCTVSRTVTTEIAATETPGAISYSCSSGVLTGQTCVTTTNTPRTVTDPCPAGTTTEIVGGQTRCKAINAQPSAGPCSATQYSASFSHGDGSSKTVCYNTTAQPTRTVIDTSTSSAPATASQAASTYSCPASHPIAKAGNMCSNSTVVQDPTTPNVQQVAPTVTCASGTVTNGAAGGAKVCLGSTTVQVPTSPNVQQVAPTVTCAAGTVSNGAAVGSKVCLGSATNTETAALITTPNAPVVSCAAGYSGPTNGQCTRTVKAPDSVTCKNGTSPVAVGKDHVCILGAADVSSKTVPVCAKGELNKDKTLCVIALSSSSSVAPAFTG